MSSHNILTKHKAGGSTEGGLQQGLLKINRALQSNAFGHIVKGGVNVLDSAARGNQIFHFYQAISDQFEGGSELRQA